MRTDVDSALKEIADFFIKNRREITMTEMRPILEKHCESEAELAKFMLFLGTESGQLRFKTLLAAPEVTKELRYAVNYMTHKPQFDKFMGKEVKPIKGYAPRVGEYHNVVLEDKGTYYLAKPALAIPKAEATKPSYLI